MNEETMNDPCHDQTFVQDLIDAQRGLYTYIFRLLPNVTDANDVLQNTNLVIMRKQSEYRHGTNFAAWVAAIAHNQVLSFRLKMQRERLFFDEQLINQLAASGAKRVGNLNPMVEALEHCKEELNLIDQDLLERRYGDGLSVAQLATVVGRGPRAISQALYRIRITLMECIQQFLASREGDSVRDPNA
jgi:RNA polymerase sigma-70 factor, ECF subfamily